MRVLVAGSTGVIGRHLVPLLVASGHTVIGMTRQASNRAGLVALGAEPVVADALDAPSVARAVADAEPDVIVHELTALSGPLNMRRFDRDFATTNRLRTEGVDHLLAAGRTVGVQRFVAASFTGWPFARVGGPMKDEADALDPTPAPGMRRSLEAIRHLEAAVIDATWTEGIVLRYGNFYGPGTALDSDGDQAELLRRRRFPVIGSGDGVWSFVHVEDAARATVAATEHGRRGIYAIVDDDPAPVSEWLPEMAMALGAKPPLRVPRWLGRALAGDAATMMMTEVRGASNAKAKRELGWTPEHPSWRTATATTSHSDRRSS